MTAALSIVLSFIVGTHTNNVTDWKSSATGVGGRLLWLLNGAVYSVRSTLEKLLY